MHDLTTIAKGCFIFKRQTHIIFLLSQNVRLILGQILSPYYVKISSDCICLFVPSRNRKTITISPHKYKVGPPVFWGEIFLLGIKLPLNINCELSRATAAAALVYRTQTNVRISDASVVLVRCRNAYAAES